jgi:hypothetical protein
LNPMAWYIFQFHRPGRGRPLTISRILTREGAAVSVGLHHREVTHPPGASPDREKVYFLAPKSLFRQRKSKLRHFKNDIPVSDPHSVS